MSKKEKAPGKFITVLKLFKRNFISLHHLIWGTGWKKFGAAVVITLVLLTVLMVISMEVTSQPKFCSFCHNMKPYYASWINSSHKHVTCTDCHFPPGLKSKIKGKFTAMSMVMNYITGIYKRNKPWAEIPDESCMRSGCHEKRLLQGKVKFKENITFDHAPHLQELRRGKKLRCTSCHSQIVQGSHISVTENTCFLCHFKKPGMDKDTENSETAKIVTSLTTCDKCHTPPVAQPGSNIKVVYDHKLVVEKKIGCSRCHGNMSIGDGYVPKNRCNTCHGEVDRIKQYDNTELIHKKHITEHKIECGQCHTEIQHKSVSRTEMVKPDCQSCHPEFHGAQLYLFAGKGGKGLPTRPSSMFEAGLNCRACHTHKKESEDFKEKGETFYTDGEACNSCHGAGYDKIMNDWITQSGVRLGQLNIALTAAEKMINSKKSDPNYEKAAELLKNAMYDYNLVKFGKAVHNIDYANQLMNTAYRLAEEAIKTTAISSKLPAFDRSTTLIPTQCSSCHSGFQWTPIPVFGWKFSHVVHLEKAKLSCQRCHSHEGGHGKLIIAKQDCMNCHHQYPPKGKESDCKQCHDTQYSIYFSKLPFSTLKIPNVMVGSATCADCHIDKNKQIVRPNKTVCSACHEKDYEQMFVDWQENSKALLEQLRDKVKRGKLREGDPAFDLLMKLEKDGSNGVHNPELYEKLIDEALK